ncbi:uncharacterized protein [Montipora capricornis]|uniref:uncharacterized protein n=1 Tax=Montipora capricornis TaxID=246305 RepID=UPI0035F13E70
MNSKFGWLLSGPLIQAELPKEIIETHCYRIKVIPAQENETLNEILPRFWELHSLEIVDSLNVEDEVLRHFNESLSFNEQGGRFSVQLPWKQDRPPLPSNLGLCKKRLRALVGRLGRNPEQLVNYDQITHSQFKNGSLKSLKDCLHVRPSLPPDLSALLMKFRVPQIAMTAEIEKAFLQVEISEVDRDGTGFLSIKNLQEPMDAEKNIASYRFRLVLFGASPSPFLLGATLRHHLGKKKRMIGSQRT